MFEFYKYSYFDEDIFCNFFFEFLSKAIIDLINFYDLPMILSFVYKKRKERKSGIELRANLRFLNDNVIYFKKSKFKKGVKNEIQKSEYNNDLNFFLSKALNQRNKHMNIVSRIPLNSKKIHENLKSEKIRSEINIKEESKKINDWKDSEEETEKKYRDINAIKYMKEWFYLRNESKFFPKDQCSNCGFSFFSETKGKFYYIEAHHKIPFSKILRRGKYYNIDEVEEHFSFLCPNCHKIADKENEKEW